MDAFLQLTVIDSRLEPAAHCLVCGKEISAGEGVTARYQGETLRFKCPGCYARFASDPGRYLSGQAVSCCGETHADSHLGESTEP